MPAIRTSPLLISLCLTLLCACRDSPVEVVEAASEAASSGDLVTVKQQFSVTTSQRLERAWQLSGTRETMGWQALAHKLTFEGRPLVVLSETIYGDYAQVMARAGVVERDYYLRKEDGLWRIELGAGIRFRRAEAKVREASGEGGEGGSAEEAQK